MLQSFAGYTRETLGAEPAAWVNEHYVELAVERERERKYRKAMLAFGNS